MKAMYQALIKTSTEKPKVLVMTQTGVAAINIEGTAIHSALDIPIGCFGESLLPATDKMKSSLRNRLSDLIIIIHEISMVSKNLLFYAHIKLNKIFGVVHHKPSVGLRDITVGDFFSIATSRRRTGLFT